MFILLFACAVNIIAVMLLAPTLLMETVDKVLWVIMASIALSTIPSFLKLPLAAVWIVVSLTIFDLMLPQILFPLILMVVVSINRLDNQGHVVGFP